MTYHNPLDLYYWFVTTFSGNITIFMAIAFLAIATLSAIFKMQNVIMFLMFAIFVIMLSFYLGAVYVVVLVMAGLVMGWIVSKLWTR